MAKELAGRCGGNFFVLPTSVHEVMVLPEWGNNRKRMARDFKQMVHDVNTTELEEEDILSECIMHCCADTGKFEFF